MSCFDFLSVVNNAAVSLCVKVLGKTLFPFFLVRYFRVASLDLMATLCLAFQGGTEWFSKAAASFYSYMCFPSFLSLNQGLSTMFYGP